MSAACSGSRSSIGAPRPEAAELLLLRLARLAPLLVHGARRALLRLVLVDATVLVRVLDVLVLALALLLAPAGIVTPRLRVM